MRNRLAHPHSVRRLLVYFSLAIVVPATLASACLIAWNVSQARHAREAQLLARAEMVSAAVDLRLVELTITADALSSGDAIRGRDWSALQTRLGRFGLGPQVWMAVTDGAGTRLLNTYPAGGGAPRGLPRPADVDTAVKTGRPTISNVFLGDTSRRHVVAVNAPVDEDASARVVTLALDTVALRDLLATLTMSDNVMLVTLVDRNHRIIARTRDHQRFVGELATPQMRSAMQRDGSSIVASRSLDGDPTIVAYARSNLTGWTTMVVVPRKDLDRPILTNAAVLSGGTILLLALGLLAAHVLGRVLTTELRDLEADAIRLGQGKTVPIRQGPFTQVNTVHGALSLAGVELLRRQERQELMIHELNHRVKNTLASVQSLATQTFRGDPREATARFEKRLHAYAQAHDLLTQAEWSAVDIRDVADRCATHSGGDKIEASGPSVLLQPHAALALCMCLHELSTNSFKYGALSVSDGHVQLCWVTPEHGGLEMEWREVGGPPAHPPTSVGFGTRLVDRLVKTELAGKLERAFTADGLVVRGRFHLETGDRWRNDFKS